MKFRLDIQRDKDESVDEMVDALVGEVREILSNIGTTRKTAKRNDAMGLTVLKEPEVLKKQNDRKRARRCLDQHSIDHIGGFDCDYPNGYVRVVFDGLAFNDYIWLKALLEEKAERKCEDDE